MDKIDKVYRKGDRNFAGLWSKTQLCDFSCDPSSDAKEILEMQV